MRVASFGFALSVVAVLAARAHAQGYVPPAAASQNEGAVVPDPRPAWWADSPPRLEPPAPPEWLRARARARATFFPGLVLLDAGAFFAMLASISAHPFCYDFGFDEYGETRSCDGDQGAAIRYGVASGIVGAFGIGLTIVGGTRIHRVRADRRLRESSLHLAMSSTPASAAPTSLVYSLRF